MNSCSLASMSANKVLTYLAGEGVLGEEYEMQSGEGKSRVSTLVGAESKKRFEGAGRALAEAEERRRRLDDVAPSRREINGRGGLDPARYGDWEVKGIASDF